MISLAAGVLRVAAGERHGKRNPDVQREAACLRLNAALVCHRRRHGDANGIGGNNRAGRDTRR